MHIDDSSSILSKKLEMVASVMKSRDIICEDIRNQILCKLFSDIIIRSDVYVKNDLQVISDHGKYISFIKENINNMSISDEDKKRLFILLKNKQE